MLTFQSVNALQKRKEKSQLNNGGCAQTYRMQMLTAGRRKNPWVLYLLNIRDCFQLVLVVRIIALTHYVYMLAYLGLLVFKLVNFDESCFIHSGILSHFFSQSLCVSMKLRVKLHVYDLQAAMQYQLSFNLQCKPIVGSFFIPLCHLIGGHCPYPISPFVWNNVKCELVVIQVLLRTCYDSSS